MAISRTFVYELNEEFGNMGFRPTWFDNAYAVTADTLFHDILEHFPGQTDPMSGELQALGAFCFLRWESQNESLQNEISGLINEMLNGQISAPVTIHSRPLRGDYAYFEDPIMDATDKALQALAESDATAEDVARVHALRSSLSGHIRAGLRTAVKRYGHFDVYGIATTLKKNLENAGNKLLTGNCLASGDKVRWSLDLRTLSVRTFINGYDAEDLGIL